MSWSPDGEVLAVSAANKHDFHVSVMLTKKSNFKKASKLIGHRFGDQ